MIESEDILTIVMEIQSKLAVIFIETQGEFRIFLPTGYQFSYQYQMF